MVNWSETILQMLDSGDTYEQIIAHFNHPVVTERFIKNAVDSRYRLTRKRIVTSIVRQRENCPQEGSQFYPIFMYMQANGGKGKFLEHLKERKLTLAALGRELNVPDYAVRNFMRYYFRNGSERIPAYYENYPGMHMRVKMQQLVAGTYVPKKKKFTIKEAKELW